ncbi:MAG TPA: phage capsid protein [Allosphingosinicella sp.]|nr:phage capsid protein [Allosphingosinicella sp.]
MAVPSDIEVARTIEYGLGVDYQLNERPGKLRPLVGSSKAYTDKAAQIEDQFDDLVAQEKDERNGDTVNTDLSLVRRWIHKPKTQNVAPLLDRDDAMTTKVDLHSPAVVQTAKAIRRAQDDRWLEGYYGTAYTGETGTTAVPFKAANILAVDADEAAPRGITLNKLIAMQEMITEALNDEDEMPIGIITAKQVSDLLKLNQVQSKDYNPDLPGALKTGKVGTFMGFRWINTQLGNARVYPRGASLTVDGSGYRRVPFLLPSGMHWGSWCDFFGKISDRGDKNHSQQIYGETCGKSTRVNEDKCFQMLCLES